MSECQKDNELTREYEKLEEQIEKLRSQLRSVENFYSVSVDRRREEDRKLEDSLACAEQEHKNIVQEMQNTERENRNLTRENRVHVAHLIDKKKKVKICLGGIYQKFFDCAIAPK